MNLHVALELEISGEEDIKDEEVKKDFVEEVRCQICEAVAYKFNFFEKGEIVYPHPRRWGGLMSQSMLAEYREKHPVTYKDAKKYWFIVCPLELLSEHILLKDQYRKCEGALNLGNVFLYLRFKEVREGLAELQEKQKNEFDFEKAASIVLNENQRDFSIRVAEAFFTDEELRDKFEKLLNKIRKGSRIRGIKKESS